MENLNPIRYDQVIIKSENHLRTVCPGDINVNISYDTSNNNRLTNPEKKDKEILKGNHQSSSSPLNYQNYLYKNRDPIRQTRAVVTRPKWITSGVIQKREDLNKYGENQKYSRQADCAKDLDTKVVQGSESSISVQEEDPKRRDGSNSDGKFIEKSPLVGLDSTEEFPTEIDCPRTQSPASNYHGWVTTESFLRSNALTKTTLEKLATFRYNSCRANGHTRIKNLQQTDAPLIPSNLGLLAEKVIMSGISNPDGMCQLARIPTTANKHENYCSKETHENSQINREHLSYQISEQIFINGEKFRQPELRQHDIDPSNSSTASESCTLARDNFESVNKCAIESCYLAPAPSTKTEEFYVPAERDYSTICRKDEGPNRTPCIELQDISDKNDEYSEGINDSDLLSFFPDLPATDNSCELGESKGKNIYSPQETTAFNESKEGVVYTELLDSIRLINNEDEFSIDADLEKELFHVQSPTIEPLRGYEDNKKNYDKKPSSGVTVKRLKRNFSDANPELTSNLSVKRPRISDSDNHTLRGNFISKISTEGQKEQTHNLIIHGQSGDNSLMGRPTFRNDNVSPPDSASCSSRNKIDEAIDHRPFARKNFPTLVDDCSPIRGLSSGSFLRVCFRVGEFFREAGRCHKLKQAPVMELFARIRSSYRELGTMRQKFHFADIWHDRPPHPVGLLLDGSEEQIESISKALVRVLGILKRDNKQASGWLFYVINIRKTDWHEIGETRRIIDAEKVGERVQERKMVPR
ncbi:BgTH12-05278 [Blumeria graminis f. sp. triticale]|uniref:BgtA-20728 n=3 Tax=Blumeria graminis TaxID=34373 RepID=A0A9X9QD75_BLUGR|nr:hypothetical protein BGT96224_A20728 [Blumeria graminis f. sp. tritici 96224]CAD6502688.1 BgTH12-05278 [Blumeria graminis f. sp. triticale]VDB88124.1 BgtA-20728 [Blumeria graminis f. sp. tritici]